MLSVLIQFNIHSIRTKAYKVTTFSEYSKTIAPNLVNRNFNPPLPNMIWVGDITYIKTAQGWLYLSIVKDLCTKKIVGYSFSNRIDSKLLCKALLMAINLKIQLTISSSTLIAALNILPLTSGSY